MSLKIIFYTMLAIIAFAANSILCRLALKTMSIDPISFTQLRLLSGCVMLVVLVKLFHPKANRPPLCFSSKKRWFSAILLFIYALFFSLAYTSLDTATGALILFGAVQMTMIINSYFSGNKLSIYQWIGTVLAFSGFVYLMLPSAQTPSMWSAILMVLSGVSWGLYTLAGRQSSWPLLDTTYNFTLSLPFVFLLLPYNWSQAYFNNDGVLLALASGALASGLGYAIWYKAVRQLKIIDAAIVQLMVPVVAAVGGALLVSEALSLSLVISSALILGGILLVIVKAPKKVK